MPLRRQRGRLSDRLGLLSSITVADFGWAVTGPVLSRFLVHHGLGVTQQGLVGLCHLTGWPNSRSVRAMILPTGSVITAEMNVKPE